MTIVQKDGQYIIKIPVENISKAEIKSMLKYIEVRGITASKRNWQKSVRMGRLLKKDSLAKYGPK